MDLLVESADISELHEHPDNPRRGDMTVIAESLREHGQYQALVVQRSTNYVLAGNHRLRAARDVLGWKVVDVTYVDVDDEQATKILLIDNRSGDKGRMDGRDLAEILGSLQSFEGTGYKRDDLDSLLEKLSPPALPPKFDDDDEDEEAGGAYKIAFASIDDRKEWTELLRALAERYPDIPLASNRLIAALKAHLAVGA